MKIIKPCQNITKEEFLEIGEEGAIYILHGENKNRLYKMTDLEAIRSYFAMKWEELVMRVYELFGYNEPIHLIRFVTY